MRPSTLVTVCESDGQQAAIAMAQSFLLHHPDARARIVVADARRTVDNVEATTNGIDISTGADVHDSIERLGGAFRPDELALALVPFALSKAVQPAVYLGPDAIVTAPIELPDAALAVLASGANGHGVCDDGFIAVSARTPALAWWCDAVERLEPPAQPFDEILSRFTDVALLHDSAWNRNIRLTGHDGRSHFAELPDGTALDDRLRYLYRRALTANELTRSIFESGGEHAFRVWLNDVDASPAAGGVSRYAFDVWRTRGDVQQAYPNLRDAVDRGGFLEWIQAYGANQEGMPRWALPEPGGVDDPGEGVAPLAVNLIGHLQSDLGVGEVGRRVALALDTAQVPFLPAQGVTAPATRRGSSFGVTAPQGAAFDINIVCINADGLNEFVREAGTDFLAGRYTIGYWWWEVLEFPPELHAAFDLVDEIWVGSSFVQEALGAVSPVPVVRMPMVAETPVVAPRTRAELGMPEGFLVLFMFDFNSVLERKNPLGLIEAFTRAFPEGGEASLVIKCINGEHRPDSRERLLAAAAQHPDIHVDERFLDAADRDALVASCDAYVSLHRSEGFGLTLAEAMALGRPVIATAWSGNTDFMTAANSWPIPYSLVAIGDGNAPYAANSQWADPDLNAAAAAMREVHADPASACERAQRGATEIRNRHAPGTAGAAMRERLEMVAPRSRARAALARRAHVAALLADAREQVSVAPDAYPARSPVRRIMRRILLTLTRPLVTSQRKSNDALLDAFERMTSDASRDREARRRADMLLASSALSRQRALERRLDELDRRVQGGR